MTEPTGPAERSRGGALWLVLGAVVLACVVAVAESARAGVAVLVATLVLLTAVRGRLRGRRPEGFAIRSVLVDLATMAVAALALTVLSTTPGV